MGFEVLKRIGKKLHDRFIDTEDHTQHTAGYAGKYCAQSDQRALQDAVDELERIYILFHFLIHMFINPFTIV